MVEEVLSLRKMQTAGWVVLVVMVAVSALFVSLQFAGSVLVGGVVSMVSFWLSYNDVVRLVDSVVLMSSPEAKKETARQGQKGY